ncbi:growth-regulating factor 4 [Lolium perenne]|uniref:growth-regulating factor 4 n=1 Tax=Lolium perenne TaxID=4522 RepID=UPI0021EA79E8|nr:growth-regulating factor 4-like [Lolium perenne]
MAMPYASLSPAADHRASPAATASLLPFCRSAPFSSSSAGGNGVAEDAGMYARWMARPLPFTAAQHEELQQQALIYKHLVAGVPVPPELVLPIRRGLEALAARFYHNPIAAGYGSYTCLGKKVDPEPGRCRRTDGKKWRCAREAASDSKYCERHMHRGRSRSRKPVETPQPAPHPQSPRTAVANGNSFQSHSLYPAIGGNNNGGGGGGNSSFSSAMGTAQLHMGGSASPYAALAGGGGTCKDLRYTAYGIRSFADEHSQLITEAVNTAMEHPWRQQPPTTTAFPISSYSQLGGATNTVKAEQRQQQPISFLGCGGDFDTGKEEEESQTLRPFFDEWPKARDSWSGEKSNLTSFSSTHLSISAGEPFTMVNTEDFSSEMTITNSPSTNGYY